MNVILPRVMDGFEQSIGRVAEFDRIVECYRSRVFRFALASLRDRDAAETVAQDCFLKAHAAYGSFRGECSMQTWLMGITINLIRDQLRNRRLQFWRRTRSLALSTDDYVLRNARAGERSPEVMAVLKQQVASVWAAAECLPDRQRCVFLLRFVEDMDILEIGAATGMKEGTVKQHLFRALQAVRLRMGSSK
jgi:RNA polymerase sigma-70 factor, ECF subfamily